MLNPFEFGEARYLPDSSTTFHNQPEYIVSQQFFASLIGVIAIGLPILMLTYGIIGDCFYGSLSHFYYAAFFGDLFVVSLSMIGVFLLSYRGRNPKENLLASYAGISALGVALFPTTGVGLAELSGKICAGRGFYTFGSGAKIPSYTLFPGVEFFHYASAAFLFAFLAYYTLVVFTRIVPQEHNDQNNQLTSRKKNRNSIYYCSGAAILFSIFALFLHATIGEDWVIWGKLKLTFWFESLALWAFGLSWIVKGRFFGRVMVDLSDKRIRGQRTDTTTSKLFRSIGILTGFLASVLGIFQFYLFVVPPSQALKSFEASLSFAEEDIIAGANRGFARFIRNNVDKVVFLRVSFVRPRFTTQNTLCGLEHAAYRMSATEQEYVFWHIPPNQEPSFQYAKFCAQAKTQDFVDVQDLILAVSTDPDGNACARINSHPGGIALVSDTIVGFYRISRGEDWSRKPNYELRAEIPTGPVFNDTIANAGNC